MKHLFTRTRVLAFFTGFLTATLLVAAGILIYSNLQKNKKEKDKDSPPLGGIRIPIVKDFKKEVLNSPDPLLLLIVSDEYDRPGVTEMFEAVSNKWSYQVMQYEVGSDTGYLSRLGISPFELPVVAFMYKGQLLGRHLATSVVADSAIVSWAETIVADKINVPVIYLAFPDAMTMKNPVSPDDYALGELCLFPYRYHVEGYAKCISGSTLIAEEHQLLYELLGKPALNAGNSFSLPDLPVLDVRGTTISYNISLRGYIPQGVSGYNSYSVNGITYIEQPAEMNWYNNRISFLGEIVLGKYLDEEDLTRLRLVPCDGRLMPISQNNALFALLGTYYGGNGYTTFALPDLRNIDVPVEGAKYYMAVSGFWPAMA